MPLPTDAVLNDAVPRPRWKLQTPGAFGLFHPSQNRVAPAFDGGRLRLWGHDGTRELARRQEAHALSFESRPKGLHFKGKQRVPRLKPHHGEPVERGRVGKIANRPVQSGSRHSALRNVHGFSLASTRDGHRRALSMLPWNIDETTAKRRVARADAQPPPNTVRLESPITRSPKLSKMLNTRSRSVFPSLLETSPAAKTRKAAASFFGFRRRSPSRPESHGAAEGLSAADRLTGRRSRPQTCCRPDRADCRY